MCPLYFGNILSVLSVFICLSVYLIIYLFKRQSLTDHSQWLQVATPAQPLVSNVVSFVVDGLLV